MKSSNWNDIKQAIINDIADIKKKTLRSASLNIKNMLNERGIEVTSNDNKITYTASTKEELEIGRAHFSDVIESINNNKNWLDTI